MVILTPLHPNLFSDTKTPSLIELYTQFSIQKFTDRAKPAQKNTEI